MNDILPAQAVLWRRVEDIAAGVFAGYGYGEIRMPLVERSELFKRAVGDVTDIVEKEMYSFEDRSGDHLSLRPEGTAGCVRAGIEHGLLHNQQQRLWYRGAMFRHERPQAGRYRQFHQFGAECFGIASPDADVEMLALVARLWKELGLGDMTLQLNSLGTPATRAAYRELLQAHLLRHEDALDEDARRRLHSNPLRVLDSKVPAMRAVVEAAPRLADHLDAESRAHFDEVRRALDALGIGYVLAPNLVRGLDYYTRTVFEWTSSQLGAQDAVCAGGRYDGLVAQLGGSATPAIGFAIGIERLLTLVVEAGRTSAQDQPQAYLCRFGDAALEPGLRLAERLRDEVPGLRLLVNSGGGSLKQQLRRADQSGAACALILGEEEVVKETVQVKSLRFEHPASTCAWGDAAEQLSEFLRLAARRGEGEQ
jgi:histidyl-tRNA synthetase